MIVRGAFNWHRMHLQDGIMTTLIIIIIIADCDRPFCADRSSLLLPADGSGRGSAR